MPDLPLGFLARPIAHRALHGRDRPENSLAAIRAAIAAGYGIEIDIQPSREGTPMVFHDETLDRLTGLRGAIRALPAARLRTTALTLQGGTARREGAGREEASHEEPAPEGIPTLREVLDLVAGRVPLLIEVKDQTGTLGPGADALEAAVARDLSGYEGDVAVMSFNPDCVHALARHAPDVPRGLVTCAFTADDWPAVPAERRADLARIRAFEDAGCSFISHDWTDLAAPPVARIAGLGHPVLCWTIRSAAQEQIARRIAGNVTFEGYLP
ncbi:MAG: glycerophosphodiester phosphodiesterase family protein [Roseinatronobacter sp.]